MDSTGSDARRGPAASSLSNPELASLPAAELVVHLYNEGRGSSFADVALVLAARERRAADAEARIRAADEAAGRLREEMAARALEVEAQLCRAAETEALLRAEIRALERRADEAAGRLREEMAGRAVEVEAQLRRAAETEGLLRAEIRALERRADEAEARAGIGFGSSRTGGPDRAGAGEDDEEGIEVEGAEEIEPEVGEQDPAAAAAEEDDADADVDPDDSLSLNESNAIGNDDDAWENNAEALALEIVCQDAELDLDNPIPLEVIPPPVSQPNSGGEEQEAADVGGVGGTGEEGEAQNSAQNLSRAASPVFVAKGFSEADGHRGSTSNTESSLPAMHSSHEPREKGLIYNMVLKALKEKERRALAKAAAEQQPNLRCWLYAPLPSESDQEDPHEEI